MAQARALSSTTIAVLSVFFEDVSKLRYGAELTRMSGVKSGSLYPVLDRLEESGWIAGSWEEVDPGEVKRPRRRFYTLTVPGKTFGRVAYDAAVERFAGQRWLPTARSRHSEATAW